MKNTEQQQIERLQYWEGQLLRPSDFAAAQNADNQCRWWHNRALHSAYGVGLGLEVTKNNNDGLKVECGLAYDTFGRELLVPHALRLPFPKVKPAKPGEPPESRLLILQYNPGSATQSELFCGACDSRKRTADPAWLRLSRFDPRNGVPIALVKWDATGTPDLDTDFDRPRALPIARPVLGSGVTPPDGTVWELWREVIPNTAAPPQTLGLQTRVNTSAAGFAEVPVYIAQLQTGDLQDAPHVLPPPICRVDEAAPDSFLFRIWLPHLQVQNDLELTVPNTEITEISDDGKTLTVKSNKDFQANDPVCLVGKNGIASVIKKIPPDIKTTIEINPAFTDKKKEIEGKTLRLAFLNSLDRIASLIDGLTFFPGMVVVVIGVDEVTAKLVVQYYTVVKSGNGAVTLSPSITPNLHLGDKSKPIFDVPRISIVSTASIDIARAVQNLGWHVCWVGAVCSSHPQFQCSDQVCEISVTEVC